MKKINEHQYQMDMYDFIKEEKHESEAKGESIQESHGIQPGNTKGRNDQHSQYQ